MVDLNSFNILITPKTKNINFNVVNHRVTGNFQVEVVDSILVVEKIQIEMILKNLNILIEVFIKIGSEKNYILVVLFRNILKVFLNISI